MLPSPYQLPVRRDGIRPGALVSGIVGLAAVNIFFVLFLFSLFASASSSAPSSAPLLVVTRLWYTLRVPRTRKVP